MQRIHWTAAVLLAATLATGATDTGTDPTNKCAWSENAGWLDAHSSEHNLTVHYYEGVGGWLSGHAWGENIGWIVLGSATGGPYLNSSADNWGVNLAANGDLAGYAWGENVGWINFDHSLCDAAIDTANGTFSGHAWGENIGWMKFKGIAPDYTVRTLAFDTQPLGTPNWWLAYHGVQENSDAGDGVPASDKYVMDTDPNVAGDYLRITAVSNASPGATDVIFTPASPRRYYSLSQRNNLTADSWSNVTGQIAVPGSGDQTIRVTNTANRAFYSVKATVTP